MQGMSCISMSHIFMACIFQWSVTFMSNIVTSCLFVSYIFSALANLYDVLCCHTKKNCGHEVQPIMRSSRILQKLRQRRLEECVGVFT